MALQLAPRENMALTLADSFLNDLDELEEDVQQQAAKAAGKPAKAAKAKGDDDDDDDDDLAADLDDLDESDEEDEGEGLESGAGPATGLGLDGIAKLRKSDRYCQHMASVAEYAAVAAAPGSIGIGGDDAEYALIVESNEVLVKLDAEIHVIHRYVNDVYAKKFPELDTLIPSKLDYMRVVKRMRNEMDMTQVDLSDILPPTVVMVVSVTGSTTSGQPLSEGELDECARGCDECLALDEDKMTILHYLESRMSVLAPNLTRLVGSSLAAMLVGMAGGLEKLANVPACNLTVMGQEKRHLAGFGNVAGMPHTGVLYFSDLVQSTPPFLRRKALKIVASKASLAARIDAYTGDAGDYGQAEAFRDEIRAKIDKLCEPPKAQKIKALPPPDIMTGKKKRGGRRVRHAKDKLKSTEMRQSLNTRSFAHTLGAEYGDDSMGLDFGMLAKEGGKLRAPTKKEKQSSISQKRRKMIQMSSGATNGLSSSLVFTPVQGIELANPNQNQGAVDAANEKWFAKSSGFQSALPQSKPGLFG
ncbi:hypothetical protein M885DRAFT_583331 [Pelagophyceae sp. CCMP2097]|nr:hypothetical protein M885DRAFT_583331 [Pelagophyceae sp. CCMP2097]